MNLIERIVNGMEALKGDVESFCHIMVSDNGDSLTTGFIKLSLALSTCLIMLIPTWLGISIFTLSVWACDVQSELITILMALVLVFILTIPQLWLIFSGLCIIVLILVA